MHTSVEPRSSRKLFYLAGGALVVVAAVVFAGWYFLIRDTSPAGVNTVEQAEARDAAIAEAAAADEPSDEPTDEPAEDPAPPPGVDGMWSVDTTIGSFDDFSSSFAGFRIDEELASLGAKTVVGRTPDVSGALEIEGTTITSTDILVDMTTLTTDSASRNRQIKRQAIETDTFPEAAFSLTSPIELGSLPADGESVAVTAVGDLTVHGVTQTVEIPLTAELNSGVVVVVGEINLVLADYDIDQPQAVVVLSVADNAGMELQLFFTR